MNNYCFYEIEKEIAEKEKELKRAEKSSRRTTLFLIIVNGVALLINFIDAVLKSIC